MATRLYVLSYVAEGFSLPFSDNKARTIPLSDVIYPQKKLSQAIFSLLSLVEEGLVPSRTSGAHKGLSYMNAVLGSKVIRPYFSLATFLFF